MSTAIMHSTSLYDFGEYPRKNQTNSSRGNTQMIVGGSGGVGVVGGNGVSMNGTASGSSNSQMILSQSFNVAAALVANNHHLLQQQQQQQQAQQSQQLQQQQQQQYPYQKQTGAVHKHQHHGSGGVHHALHRTVSQPETAFTVENLLDMLTLNVPKMMDNVTLAGLASAATGANSSATAINSNSGNNHTSNTSSSSGHRKLERTQSEPLPQQVNTSRYKTELCRPYEEAGECKYGDKCQFAHGMQELRNLQRHPKYKTELCRTFHSVGFCPYGPRCHFVHNAEEARNHNRNVAAYHARLAAAAAAASGSTASQSSKNNNGPSVINSNNQQPQQQHAHHHNQQQHASGGLNVMQAAAILRQSSITVHQQHVHHHQHLQLPLSPALSMSTGSDRASPIGSLSLSPTTSMANFFPEAGSPTFQQAFSFPSSPPASPIDGLSPMATPPPSSPSLVAMKLGGSMVLGGGGHAAGNVASASSGLEERLPVFNLLSSAMDPFVNLAL